MTEQKVSAVHAYASIYGGGARAPVASTRVGVPCEDRLSSAGVHSVALAPCWHSNFAEWSGAEWSLRGDSTTVRLRLHEQDLCACCGCEVHEV